MSTTYEYVALRPIFWGSALAYNEGDFVPGANVEANGYVVGEDVQLRDPASLPTVEPTGDTTDSTPPEPTS